MCNVPNFQFIVHKSNFNSIIYIFSIIEKNLPTLRDFGGTNQQILHRLEADYGDQFTKKELENFMKQA